MRDPSSSSEPVSSHHQPRGLIKITQCDPKRFRRRRQAGKGLLFPRLRKQRPKQLLLLVPAFDMSFQGLDFVTRNVFQPGNISVRRPLKTELDTHLQMLRDLFLRLFARPLEAGDLCLDHCLILDCVVAHMAITVLTPWGAIFMTRSSANSIFTSPPFLPHAPDKARLAVLPVSANWEAHITAKSRAPGQPL
jgi:hypothetical protein